MIRFKKKESKIFIGITPTKIFFWIKIESQAIQLFIIFTINLYSNSETCNLINWKYYFSKVG